MSASVASSRPIVTRALTKRYGGLRAVDGVSRTTAVDAAVAYCQGTPVRAHLESHPVLDVASATEVAEAALLDRFGSSTFEAPTRWLQVVASKA